MRKKKSQPVNAPPPRGFSAIPGRKLPPPTVARERRDRDLSLVADYAATVDRDLHPRDRTPRDQLLLPQTPAVSARPVREYVEIPDAAGEQTLVAWQWEQALRQTTELLRRTEINEQMLRDAVEDYARRSLACLVYPSRLDCDHKACAAHRLHVEAFRQVLKQLVPTRERR